MINQGSPEYFYVIYNDAYSVGFVLFYRCIAHRTLLAAGILSSGHKVLSVEYKGNITWGDLNDEGQITFGGEGGDLMCGMKLNLAVRTTCSVNREHQNIVWSSEEVSFPKCLDPLCC